MLTAPTSDLALRPHASNYAYICFSGRGGAGAGRTTWGLAVASPPPSGGPRSFGALLLWLFALCCESEEPLREEAGEGFPTCTWVLLLGEGPLLWT